MSNESRRVASQTYGALGLKFPLPLDSAMTVDLTDRQFRIGVLQALSEMYALLMSAGGLGAGVALTSFAELAQIVTIGASNLLQYVDEGNNGTRVWRLRTSTAATDTNAGFQRPNDYSATNQKVWTREI